MRVLGVGLGRTGTKSLHRAFEILGLKSIHYDQVRLRDVLDGSNPTPTFRRYDDVDAVTDIPTAVFYKELMDAYPECKAVLTIRDVDEWWQSSVKHQERAKPIEPTWRHRALALFSRSAAERLDSSRFKAYARNYIYGSVVPHEFLYKKRFIEYNQRVRAEIPADRLLVMDLTAGDGWELLCPFLDLPIPSRPFPHENKLREQQRETSETTR